MTDYAQGGPRLREVLKAGLPSETGRRKDAFSTPTRDVSVYGPVEGLRELSAKAAEGPWYIAPARREDGLAEIEDGRQHGMFPVAGEWPEIEFIVALVNWFRSTEETQPCLPERDRLTAALGEAKDQITLLSVAKNKQDEALEEAERRCEEMAGWPLSELSEETKAALKEIDDAVRHGAIAARAIIVGAPPPPVTPSEKENDRTRVTEEMVDAACEAVMDLGVVFKTYNGLGPVMRAALEAALASIQPTPTTGLDRAGDMVLVPREPTEEMIASGAIVNWMAFEETTVYVAKLWRAMVLRALQPTAVAKPESEGER